VVEEEELGQSTGRAEVALGEAVQIRGTVQAPSGTAVEVAQDADHPDIQWEGIQAPTGVKQDAVGDFVSDAGQLGEIICGLRSGQSLELGKIKPAFGQACGCRSQVPGAVAQAQAAEQGFRGGGHLFRGGEGELGKFRAGWGKGPAQPPVDLADLDNLFERGADEAGGAGPPRVSDQP
jgi:hypothetical protein